MKTATSKGAVLLAVALAGGACGPPSLDRALPTRPGINVLIITFDALRADRLGLYGYERPVSPNLDAFAEQAVTFESAYAGGQATPTSFAAAFTGLYPHRVFRGWKLVAEETLAQVFQSAGYRTGAFLHNIQLVRRRGFDPGFDTFEIRRHFDERGMTEEAMRWLDEHAAKPFFLWVHYISPHSKYQWRAEASHLYDPAYEGPFKRSSRLKHTPATEGGRERYRQLYDGEIFAVDQLFGELVEHVGEIGLLDETVIIVSADHGEELADRSLFGHQTLYQEVWRVPLLIRHPEGARGLRTTVPYSNVDLLPTLAAMAGLEVPPDLDGVDVRDPGRAARPTLGVAMTSRSHHAAVILDGSMKLLVRCGGKSGPRGVDLYDLAADPGETTNLSATEPERAESLFELMQSELGGRPCPLIDAAVKGAVTTQGLDEETIRELEALGYVG